MCGVETGYVPSISNVWTNLPSAITPALEISLHQSEQPIGDNTQATRVAYPTNSDSPNSFQVRRGHHLSPDRIARSLSGEEAALEKHLNGQANVK